jgi:hypothetical protein
MKLKRTKTPTNPYERLEAIKGWPNIVPTPIAEPLAPPNSKTAINRMMSSGSEVKSGDKIAPTKEPPILYL